MKNELTERCFNGWTETKEEEEKITKRLKIKQTREKK